MGDDALIFPPSSVANSYEVIVENAVNIAAVPGETLGEALVRCVRSEFAQGAHRCAFTVDAPSDGPVSSVVVQPMLSGMFLFMPGYSSNRVPRAGSSVLVRRDGFSASFPREVVLHGSGSVMSDLVLPALSDLMRSSEG